ncbi:MAG TPA: hypothetical protein VG052_06865, partial [Puia sp.]|nr:hypothetical protein [Puia sp.]
YRESKDGRTTILELHKLNEYVEAPLDIGAAPNFTPEINPTAEITGMGPSAGMGPSVKQN